MLPVTFDQLRDRAIPMQAIACVDSANWDAFGKHTNQPLWRLWGGFRDRIPMIESAGITAQVKLIWSANWHFLRMK